MHSEQKAIPWHKADLSETEIQEVTRVLQSGCLAAGPEVAAFEHEFAEYIGRKHAIATSSGTAALQLILTALDFPKEAEVIVPSLTFIATVNAVVLSGLKPVFADIDPRTLTLSRKSIREVITSNTCAVLGVDLFGNIADWDALGRIVKDVVLIEDACQALGSASSGKPAGCFGVAAAFSFFPNKIMTTGEGGMIVTDDDSLALRIQRLRSQGRLISDPAGMHYLIGFNFRMSELQAALGRSQLSRIQEFIALRRAVAEKYHAFLVGLEDKFKPLLSLSDRNGWFCFPVLLDESIDVPQVINRMRTKGIPVKRTYIPVHEQPAYEAISELRTSMDVTESIGKRIVSLPFYSRVPEQFIKRTVDELIRVCSK